MPLKSSALAALVFVTVLLITPACASTESDGALLPAGFLSARGNQIVGPDGTPVRIASVGLTGMNVIGASCLVGWQWSKAAATGNEVAATTLRSKIMCGYQGWFRCPGDAANSGWIHWSHTAERIAPETLCFEMWPDVSEYGPSERFQVPGFTCSNGSPAELFSSDNAATVQRHFEWMRDYGIDGAWMQHFLVDLPGGLQPQRYEARMRVLGHARTAAHETGRVWALSYDIAAMPTGRIYDVLVNDWKRMVDDRWAADSRYLHQGGRPVVQIWGFYWNDTHNRMTAELANKLIGFFKQPGPYAAFLVGGGSWDWRHAPDPEWQRFYRRFEAYAPWNVGNWTRDAKGQAHASISWWAKDKEEYERTGGLWLPVVYPGFSWDNLQHKPAGSTLIPRRGGRFLWEQFHELSKLGVDCVYVAMFDEVDEGTAIFKVTSSPPAEGHFVGFEGLPSDWYLRLVGEAANRLRQKLPVPFEIPLLYETGDPSTYSTRFEGTESPLSEGGVWSNNGFDWTQIRKRDGIAFGTQTGTNTGIFKFNDSYAHLAGFPPDQEAWGEARIVKSNGPCYQEIEILLRFTSAPHRTTGYECFARCVTSPSSYLQIVRWDGPLGKFTYLADQRGTNYGLNNGDILKASIIGNTITVYINGVEKARITDDTFKTGNPGIGEFLACESGQGLGSNSDFGFASFAARSIGRTNPTSTSFGRPAPIERPLRASKNPNYFADAGGNPLILCGSQTWNTLQDWGTSGSVQPLDFGAFVSFLKTHEHNFTLLWRTELPKFSNLPVTATQPPDFTVSPHPWLRTGPGFATDGALKFDLTKFDPAYFDRLRTRVEALNRAGIYAGVYLFTGEWVLRFRGPGDGYPFSGPNNVNGVDDGYRGGPAETGLAAVTMTATNAITVVQDAYVRKTIDTLNDLPNVLWIVSEEAPMKSTWWNNHLISLIKQYERGKPYQHPVGSATLESPPDSILYNSDADWVAPSAWISPTTSCGTGQPACKVNINDSDHSYFGMWNDTPQKNRNYAWKNFLTGNQVLFMDPYLVHYPRENRNLCFSPVNGIGSQPDPRWENFRNNLGYLLRYSRKPNLANVTPRNSLCSTKYCLAQTPSTGAEYLAYAPAGGAFTMDLSAMPSSRKLAVEWFDPATGQTITEYPIPAGPSSQPFNPPFSGDAVLYLVDTEGHR